MVNRPTALSLVAALALSGCATATATATDDSACEFAFVAVTTDWADDVTEYDLVLLDARLRPGRQLTDDGLSGNPDVSPDGTRIAFTNARGYPPGNDSGISSKSGISVIDVSGANERRLTRDHYDNGAQWSPDGTRIAFTRFQVGGLRQLLLLDPNTGATTLAHEGGIADFQWWSDQEIGMAIYAVDGLSRQYVLDLATGALSPVDLPPDVDAASVLWSPDRTRVAFTRQPSGTYDRDARPTLQVHDLTTGEEHTVPGSNTLQNWPLLWT
ncbi:MAG: PD40 domain-containing protein, partial [Geodermatophilaceae bacterium]|nr:PD40 domain-containing protein [Geodermatophilaceae bacterium]